MKEGFITDKMGKVVLWQMPNPALIAWAVLTLVNYFTHSPKLAWLGTALLFTWAFGELSQGVNYFRRLLGLLVLILIMAMQFR